MKLFRKIAAYLLLAMLPGAAKAIPVDYTFDVFFNGSGPGGAVPVNITLDGVTGTNTEVFRPFLGNLLAFDFTYAGQNFSAIDDTDFTLSPLIALQDGALAAITYMGRKSILGGRISYTTIIELNAQTNSTSYARVSPGIFDFSFGQIAPDTWRRVSEPVPVPATFALFALGLASLRLHRIKPLP